MRKKIVCAITIIALAGCGGNRNSKTVVDAIDSTASEKAAPLLVAKPLKKPYEAIWMRITETDSGCVVYNYPNLWNDGATKSPEMIIIKNDQFTCVFFSDDVLRYTFDNVESCDDSSYLFRVEGGARFKWVDKEKHIAQWVRYYSDGRVMTDYHYVDSLYNTFPIVDYDWAWEKRTDADD